MVINKEFKEYLHSRMDNIKNQDSIYKSLQNEFCDATKNEDNSICEESSIKIEIRVQELSYIQGFQDAMEILRGTI